jgi:hypothetical protein
MWDCVDLNEVLPFGESSVRSLGVLPDGSVLGGCGGSAAHLFLFDPPTRAVRDLRRWGRPGFVRNLMRGDGAQFWMVVGSDPGEILPDEARVEDEHLFSGSLTGGRLDLQDRGAPFPGEGFLGIALDREGKYVYGVSRPTPILFRYDLARGVFEELARLGERESYETAVTWRALGERISKYPRVLAVAPRGEIYGATEGVLFRWSPAGPDPQRKESRPVAWLESMKIPSALERRGTEGAVVEALAWGADGRLFGGTYDGYLFAADLALGKILNLGKPFRQAHIRALAADRDSRLFGLCGEPTGRCRLFSYGREGYEEIESPRNPPPGWFLSDSLDALAVAPDGTIYLGGSGRMTGLYIRKKKETER